MKKLLVFAASFFLFAHMGWPFDKAHFEINVRKHLNLTTKQKIVAGEPELSEFPCLLKVPLTIDGNPYPVYMKPDESKYFWGQLLDLTIDPDKVRADKISLTKVRYEGSAKAPVVIVEYTDLQCPYCSKMHKSLKDQLFKDYSREKVRLVFKNFPLQMHDWSEAAAVANECVGVQSSKSFWDMTDLYFEAQEKINKANFEDKTTEFLTGLKLDKEKFDLCRKDPAIKDRIMKDREEGASIGVGGTPTFFVNGRMLRGSRYEDLKLLIDEKLADIPQAATK